MKNSRPALEPQVRVLLVDQDVVFGRRLSQVLVAAPEFKLCPQVVDLTAAPKAVAAHDPGLVVTDIDPEGTGAFHFVCSLAAATAERRILATSRGCDPVEAEQVLLAGARGLLLKTEPADEILNAFRTVLQGFLYVSPALTMPLIKRLLSSPFESARSGVESLTDRELGVFELLGAGLSTREIAARLGLSCKTVESHREKIKHRLGARDAAALAQCACAWVQRGLRGGDSPRAETAARSARPRIAKRPTGTLR